MEENTCLHPLNITYIESHLNVRAKKKKGAISPRCHYLIKIWVGPFS